MLPIFTSLVQTLAVNGLSLLAGAVQAKGKEFIEKNSGAIRVESEPTAGSTFFFTLPIAL